MGCCRQVESLGGMFLFLVKVLINDVMSTMDSVKKEITFTLSPSHPYSLSFFLLLFLLPSIPPPFFPSPLLLSPLPWGRCLAWCYWRKLIIVIAFIQQCRTWRSVRKQRHHSLRFTSWVSPPLSFFPPFLPLFPSLLPSLPPFVLSTLLPGPHLSYLGVSERDVLFSATGGSSS